AGSRGSARRTSIVPWPRSSSFSAICAQIFVTEERSRVPVLNGKMRMMSSLPSMIRFRWSGRTFLRRCSTSRMTRGYWPVFWAAAAKKGKNFSPLMLS
ncbi:hypothetical protein WG66_006408, partial [Moniliophthora roreri]